MHHADAFGLTRGRSRRCDSHSGLAQCCSLPTEPRGRILAPNQTHGFGNGRLVSFTYQQNFDCVDQPTMDLDFNGKPAESDPNEMQTPICQVVTEPTADRTGGDIKHTAHLYVLVPMFSVDNDQHPEDAMACPDGGRPGEFCGVELGKILIKMFGFVPEAWKTKVDPSITTQCPDPNHAVPGTCTMHASSVDLSVLIAGPSGAATQSVFVPTPNHSHVIDNSRVNAGAIWWEVRPVLVMDRNDWPAADGSSGITSSKVMDDVEAAGRAVEVGSNLADLAAHLQTLNQPRPRGPVAVVGTDDRRRTVVERFASLVRPVGLAIGFFRDLQTASRWLDDHVPT